MGWTLHAHSHLPVVKLQSAQGADAGWLLGWPIIDRRLVRDVIVLPAGETETWLAKASGRFLAVVLSDQLSGRIYPDAGASLSLVYAPAQRSAASTTTALHLGLGDAAQYRQSKANMPPLKANQFLPAGLTSDENILRLMPNHFLDVQSWEARRYWPAEMIRRVSDAEATTLAKQIAVNTQNTIDALAAEYELSSGLSAGRDSRMVLACARNVIERVEFITFNYKDPAKFADVHIACKLAKQFRLHHRVLDLIDPPADMKAEYLYRVGYTNNAGKTCDFYDACHRLVDMKRATLSGFAGEVGRAFYWKPDEDGKPAKALETADLLSRMHLSSDANLHDANLHAAMDRWRASMPDDLDAYMLLDLMYQELRLGCWASPQLYAAAPFAANVMPLSHHESFAAMMAMLPQYRRQQKMADDVINAAWPELLDVPFQVLTGWRDLLRRIKRRLQRGKSR